MAQLIIVSWLSLLILSFSLIMPSAAASHPLCRPYDSLSLLQFKAEMLDINASTYASSACDDLGQYSYPKMMSWNKETSPDCCTWDGVTCHGITGHVIGLDLSCSRLLGVFHQNSSLFQLSCLQRLNLAFNSFNLSKISPNIGGLSNLTHLNLSNSEFGGIIPSTLSHLSKLVLLDISDNGFIYIPPKPSHLFHIIINFLIFQPGDFQILLSNLTNIRVLSLTSVDMISTTMPANWSSSLTYLNLKSTQIHGLLPYSIFHLPRLQTLILSGNQKLSISLPDSNVSTTSPLRVLDLSVTNFSSNGITDFISSFTSLRSLSLRGCGLFGSVPNFISNLSQIIQLDLMYNNFTGNIPSAISNLPKLRVLDLSSNSFTGQFPFGNRTELQILDLAFNFLSGPLPANMSGLQRLETLDLSDNAFNGTIPPWLFSSPSLMFLFLGYNYFTGQINEFITRSFVYINFRSNQLDGPIPHSISQLVNLSYFDLSWNNLSGSIDFTIFSHLNKLDILSLSNNKLSLEMKNEINISFPLLFQLELSSCEITKFPYFLKNSKKLTFLDLSNNKLHGQIPQWIPWNSLRHLNLSHNSLSRLGFSNSLPLMKNLITLDLRSNNFHESLPLFICNFELLSILDLSYNNFNGSIPKCFGNFSSNLLVLNLAKNDLKGAISMAFPKYCWLRNLNLNGNSLEGALPTSLANCKFIEVLDVGNNKINDTFPSFLENPNILQVLILKSNRFFGTISNFRNENFLPMLRVFDISDNEFMGALPVELLKSFKAMATLGRIDSKARYMGTSSSGGLYFYSMGFVVKGLVVEFTQILTTLVVIDLSSNSFKGDIPKIIGNLSALIVLNLSHNDFSGHIPSTLGQLHFLESLDLSWNQIEGEIPPQLADLTYLGFLNVSQNHLVGCIPTGKQFNTFMNDSYYGNSGLTGFPVTKNCGKMDLPSPPSEGSYQDDEKSNFVSGFTWKPVLIGHGFGTIFGFAIGCLVFFTGKQNWLVRNIEEVFLYGLLLLGKKQMCKQLIKAARRRGQKHYRRKY